MSDYDQLDGRQGLDLTQVGSANQFDHFREKIMAARATSLEARVDLVEEIILGLARIDRDQVYP